MSPVVSPVSSVVSGSRDPSLRTFKIEDVGSLVVGESQVMRDLFARIEKVSQTKSNVLIRGESGTGKELVARCLHTMSGRFREPFIAVNCAAIPENLLESELFGHVRGSFTGAIADKKGLFEEADKGTLFLDEVGDLSPSLQAKLLRVLQDRVIRAVGGHKYHRVDVRILAATHRDLKSMVLSGDFREDLYYRINVVTLFIPPLRERKADIPPLANRFLRKLCSENDIPTRSFSAEALMILMSYHWPGNVRELENLIERVLVFCEDSTIQARDVLEHLQSEGGPAPQNIYADRPSLQKLEERYIQLILDESDGAKEKAARKLGISRRTLHRKLK